MQTWQYEFVFRKNTHSNTIYFITTGRVSFYIERKNISFKDMIEGGYFGDIDIVMRRQR